MRTEVVRSDMEGKECGSLPAEVMAEEELVIRQYCMLICQICGEEEDMLRRPWRTKVSCGQIRRH